MSHSEGSVSRWEVFSSQRLIAARRVQAPGLISLAGSGFANTQLSLKAARGWDIAVCVKV